MSIIGLRLKHELEGKNRLTINPVEQKRNIATTRSFEVNYTEYEMIKERIVTFAVSCAEKLRAQHSCCNALLITLRTNKHKSNTVQVKRSTVVNLPYPTNSNIELANFAIEGLKKIFTPNLSYKKAGVITMGLTPENKRQLSFFENSNPKHQKLMQAIDTVNKKVGSHKVKLASQDLKKTWKMKQNHLSPKYTTKLSDIIEVNAKEI